MKAAVTPCILLLFIAAFCKAQSGAGIPYPQPTPDSAALRFLPGIVSSDSMDFNACFSPDGRSYYFTRSINKQTKIYVTHHDGASWTSPMLVPFLDSEYSEADPAFAPDGTLYFISDRPAGTSDTLRDFDIWFVKPLPGGSWSAPGNLESVNTDSSEYYISFSRNGNLYFASSRKGGFGEEDIYVSKLEKEKYTDPVNLGPAVNTARSEYDPGVSADEEVIVFASSNRDDGLGGADLYCSRLNGEKKWQKAANLGSGFNTKAREFCPYFSPDGKYFFFSSERDVKWMGMERFRKETGKL
jgi:Tol biopolymer transport system component